MPPPSAVILTRLSALVEADGRSPEALSVAAGKGRAYYRRKLTGIHPMTLTDLDELLALLGVGLDAIVGAPPLSIPNRDHLVSVLD